jgi:hypothetical protein
MSQSANLPEKENQLSLSEIEELRSLVQAQKAEIEELRSLIQAQNARIDFLEKFAANNRLRIKNSKALNALLVVLCIPFLISADFQFGDKWSGNVKSRQLETTEILIFVAIGSAAIGVISVEELIGFFKRK